MSAYAEQVFNRPPDDGDDWTPSDDEAPDAPPVPEQARATARVENLNLAPPAPRLPRLGVADIFAPLPPVPWLVQSLDLCPGAPALVAGYGYTGKTAAVQCMAVEIAAGLPVWGSFSARQGRVLHVDYEQGRRLTLERYQRLAAAHLLTPDELADRLEVIVMPPAYLDDLAAERVFTRECEGADLLIIDSLRAACPTIEENSSEVRRVLDLLGRVSEKTGTTCVVIHHARKPSIDKSGGAKMAIRGSGAIFDACSSVLVLEADKGEPTRVSHEKARTSGITASDFELVIDDVELDGNPRGGLSVTAQARTIGTVADADSAARGHLDGVCERIRELFREKGDQPSKGAVVEHIGAKRSTVFAAIDVLVGAGEVEITGRKLQWKAGTV